MNRLKTFALLVAIFASAMCASAQTAGRINDTAFETVTIAGQKVTQPIPFATITVCTSAGTGTPCTPLASSSNCCFSDAAMTHQIGQTFTADLNGNYGFYAAPGQYEVSITANGVTGRLVAYTVPGSGSLPSGTQGQPLINMGGSTTYTTSALYLDASQFSGADIGAKVNAAIAAASSGQTVRMPCGNYAFSTEITVSKTIKLAGCGRGELDGATARYGTYLDWTGTGGTGILVDGAGANIQPTLEDFSLDNTGTGAVGIDIERASASIVQRVTIWPQTTGFSTAAIGIGLTQISVDVTLRDDYIRNSGVNLLAQNVDAHLVLDHFRSINGNVVLGSSSNSVESLQSVDSTFEPDDATYDGIDIIRVDGMSIRGSYFEFGNGHYGIDCDGASGTYPAVLCHGLDIEGNYVSGSDGTGATYAFRSNLSTADWKIEGNYFTAFANPADIVNNASSESVMLAGNKTNSSGMIAYDTATNVTEISDDLAVGGITSALLPKNLTVGGMTGGPFCVHETSGALSATAADCNSGGAPSGPAGGALADTFPNPKTVTPLAEYTFSVSAGTVTAIPNFAGGTIYTGTDAAVVINNVLGTLAATGGTLYFHSGTYNFNSATQETVAGYTLYYCVGIPSANATTYPDFHFIGDGGQTASQVGVLGVGNPTGVIFNVTSAAETAAGSGNVLVAFWQRPNTATLGGYAWNSNDFFENISVQFPANTRGKEIGIDCIEAAYAKIYNVTASFVAAPTAAAASGDTAFVTPANFALGSDVRFDTAVGWETCFEIDSEHSVVVNTLAYHCTNAYYYARNTNSRNQSNYHGIVFIHPQVYDSIHGITIGTHVAGTPEIDILNLDLEYITTGAWTYQDGINESSPGTTYGFVTWNDIRTNVGVGSLASPFAAGSGGTYTVQTANQSGSASTDFGGASFSTASKNGVVGLVSQDSILPLSGFIAQVTCQIATVAVSSNVLTVTCSNTFTLSTTFGVGTDVNLDGLTTASFLNGTSVTVTSATSSSFTAAFTHANYTSAADTGVATAQMDLRLETRSGSLVDALNSLGEFQIGDGNYNNHTFQKWAGIGLASAKFAGHVNAPAYLTATNCSSSAAPAVCGSAAAGSFVVAASSTSVVVDTSAVTANSQIFLQFDSSLGTNLGVTCNTTFDQAYVTARTGGTSFTVTASAPTTNPACYSYHIVN